MNLVRAVLSCTVAALLFTAPEGAAAQQPVHWQLSRAPARAAAAGGRGLRLRLTATMDAGWYIYSLTQPPGGPFATVVTLPETDPLRLDGAIDAPPPETHDDPNFGIVTELYRSGVSFELPVGGDDATLVLVRYQACNDRMCLPPRTDTVRLALAAAPGAAATPSLSSTPDAPASPIRDPAPSGAPVSATPPRGSPPAPSASPPAAGPSPATGVDAGVATAGGALGAFLWLAALMGLLSLLTPCVFPMVPITVGFFTRAQPPAAGADAAGGAPVRPVEATADRRAALTGAVVYAVGIVASFCALGALVTLAFGAGGVIRLAASPWLNLAVAALFLGFALNLLGAYELRLPARLLTRLATPAGRHGAGAAFLLGGAFAVTTFTCTAPFVGTLLVLATQGSWSWPLLGLLAFATAFALPFFLLALVPRGLERLPRSGAWLLTLRRGLGVLEIAAAAKFLSNVDLVWGWGVFSRDVVLGLWAAAALALALVLFGRPGDWRPPLYRGRAPRAGLVLLALLGAWWLTTGMRGARLGEVEAFLPPGAGGALPGDVARGELAWGLNDFEGSLRRAGAQQRPLLIDFTGYTCTNCRWMEANMFPRAEVRARLEPFVRVRLFTDGVGEPFASQQALEERLFGTVALPLYAILSPSGQAVASFTGMTRDPARFAAFLARGLEQARAR